MGPGGAKAYLLLIRGLEETREDKDREDVEQNVHPQQDPGHEEHARPQRARCLNRVVHDELPVVQRQDLEH